MRIYGRSFQLYSPPYVDRVWGDIRVILGYMGIMEKKMETTIMGYIGYKIWGIWGSSYKMPKAIFDLLTGN